MLESKPSKTTSKMVGNAGLQRGQGGNADHRDERDRLSNDVFISYSRKDKAFVEVLSAAFRQRGRDPWVDWDDIYKGEDWWQAIQRGIESANTFVFVISPDSVASAVCRDEIEYAAQCHKRFLPILRREEFDQKQIHALVSKHNWLFFRETDNFDAAFEDLLRAIDTDIDHVHAHTRLLVRASEWQRKNNDRSYLLRGSDLQDAEQWMIRGLTQDPKPTELQTQYIQASQAAKTALVKARQRAKWVVMLSTVAVNMAIVTLGFYWFYHYLWETTIARVKTDLVQALNAAIAGTNGDDFAALAQTRLPPGQAEPLNDPLYVKHQEWLYRVHTLVPYARPYSYIPGQQSSEVLASEVLVIGDVLRIIQPQNATVFRQPYTASQAQNDVYKGFTDLATTTFVSRDRRGAQFAAYAPIHNSAGAVVGAMGLDVDASYVSRLKRSVQNLMLMAYIIAFIWFLGLSVLILRVTRPLSDEA
jgi:TIR domain